MFNRGNLNGTVITSAAATVLAAIVILVNLPSILAALFGPGPGSDDPYQTVAALLESHESEMETYRARFEGRSIFFPPPPPPPQTRPREERAPAPPPRVEPPPPVDTGPPPPPPLYGGPPVAGAAGNEVWFKSRSANEPGVRLSVGEESNGLKVIAINAPRTVRLGWQRGEYDVPIFPDWGPVALNSEPPGGGRLAGLIVAPQTEIEAERHRLAEETFQDTHGAIPESRFDRERARAERSGREPMAEDPEEPEPFDEPEDPEVPEEPEVPDDPQSDEPQSDEPQADDPQADGPQSDEPQSDDPQADEPQSDDPQSDERQADEPESPFEAEEPGPDADDPASGDDPPDADPDEQPAPAGDK